MDMSHDLKNALDEDLQSAKTVTARIKALRNMIAASKRIATVLGIRPKAGEKAAVIQEIKINSMILDELQAMRRAQFVAYLEDREIKARREIYLEEIVHTEGLSRKSRSSSLPSRGSSTSSATRGRP